MRRLWLIFTQAVTILLAGLFVVQTLKPEWLANRPSRAPLAVVEPAAAPPNPAATRANSYSNAVQGAAPAVVNIYTAKAVRTSRHPFIEDPLFRRFFGELFEGETQRTSSLGSGVIVSDQGFIVTNNHVVEAADEIEVATANGKKLPARIVGTDPDTDLAVLRVNSDQLPAITFGQSDTLKVGDVVLAIGNPFSVGQSVTMGIVSALGRSNLDINTFENFIQTDAAINPGNSGGALIDTTGHLVGINTAIYSRSGGSLGIGFAIPVSTARSVIEQLIATGSVSRGWIGVEAQEVTGELADSFKLPEPRGALIANVMRGGPADRGGVRAGDVLLAVDGRPIADRQSMLNVVASLTPEQRVPLKIWRDRKELDVPVVVGKRPALPRQR
ncbi:MAG: Do family serine endopeptidase [Burkholderiales bacterium]